MFSSEQYFKNFGQAPETIKDLLLSDGIDKTISSIISRYKLEQFTSRIVLVIGDVLVGLIPVKKFIQALQEYAGLSPETAKNVAHDARENLFAQVAQELAGMQEEAEKNYMAQMSNTQVQTANKVLNPNIQIENVPKETLPSTQTYSLVQKHPSFHNPITNSPSQPKSLEALQNEILPPPPDLPIGKSVSRIPHPAYSEKPQGSTRSFPDEHTVDLRDKRN